MSWMATYTGEKFWVKEPAKTIIKLPDIAHATSNLCRFGGHTRVFYSVAQHSTMVSYIVAALGGTLNEQLWGLMHDAAEAYLIDLPTPIKVEFQEKYEAMEKEILKAIQLQLGLQDLGPRTELPAKVKEADRIALVTEARQLMVNGIDEWQPSYHLIQPHPVLINPQSPAAAKEDFLFRYGYLTDLIKEAEGTDWDEVNSPLSKRRK